MISGFVHRPNGNESRLTNDKISKTPAIIAIFNCIRPEYDVPPKYVSQAAVTMVSNRMIIVRMLHKLKNQHGPNSMQARLAFHFL